jgi:hypothetical protein
MTLTRGGGNVSRETIGPARQGLFKQAPGPALTLGPHATNPATLSLRTGIEEQEKI